MIRPLKPWIYKGFTNRGFTLVILLVGDKTSYAQRWGGNMLEDRQQFRMVFFCIFGIVVPYRF